MPYIIKEMFQDEARIYFYPTRPIREGADWFRYYTIDVETKAKLGAGKPWTPLATQWYYYALLFWLPLDVVLPIPKWLLPAKLRHEWKEVLK